MHIMETAGNLTEENFVSFNFTAYSKHAMVFAESTGVFFAPLTLNEINIAEFIIQLRYRCCFELLRSIG